MNILALSLDSEMFVEHSQVRNRVEALAKLVNTYTVIVPYYCSITINASSKITIIGSGGTIFLWKLVRFFCSCAFFLKKNDIDVITVQDPYGLGMIGAVLSWWFDIPLEIQWHGKHESQHWWWNMIARFSLRMADHVRVVSLRLKKEIIALGVPSCHISVVPISTQFSVQSARVESHVPFTFITVGRLVPVKQITLQLEAVAILKQKTDIPFQLRIIGDGILYSAIETYIKEKHIDDVVMLLGWNTKEQLEQQYTQADCLLLTSVSEGWGRVVLEAGSYGVPTIMTDVGLAGEVIIHNYNGKILDIQDPQALALEMENIILDHDLFVALSQGIVHTMLMMPTQEQTLYRYYEGWRACIDTKV